MISTLGGAGIAFTARVWANLLSKNRAFYRPWNHALCLVTGGYIGYNWEKWETELIVAVNEKRAARGMPIISRKMIWTPSATYSTKAVEDK